MEEEQRHSTAYSENIEDTRVFRPNPKRRQQAEDMVSQIFDAIRTEGEPSIVPDDHHPSREGGLQSYSRRDWQSSRQGPSAPGRKPPGKRLAPRKAARLRGSPRHRKLALVLISAVLVLTMLYCVAVYSNIPFIKKWRDIYIETAMGTMTHQWLATAFIPQSVIDDVMNVRTDLEEEQIDISSEWDMEVPEIAEEKLAWSSLIEDFFELYSEIDEESFEAYMNIHGVDCLTEEGYLLIDQSGLTDKGTTIKTTAGDQVLVIDTENGIVIVKVTGDDYVGKLAIVKNPAQVALELCSYFGERGSIIENIVKRSEGILAINASGFYDPDGKGNGGTAHGIVVSHGKTYQGFAGGNNKVIGFDNANQLNVVKYQENLDFRDAVEFKPILVLDGEKQVSGSAGWGIQPRTAIGQTKNGQVLMLVIDGRQPGYSIGCTLGDLADIMERYLAEQACNLDGGSSSIMFYRGRKITQPSAGDKENGRLLPNAFVVSGR